MIDASAVKTSKAPAARAAHARCAPHSVAIAPSLRCLHRLRRPRGCPFKSRPTATAQPHASPASSLAASPALRAGCMRDLRSLSARDSLARRSSRPKGARRRAPPPRSFISDRRRHSRPFKYRIVAIDLQHSLPYSLTTVPVLTGTEAECVSWIESQRAEVPVFRPDRLGTHRTVTQPAPRPSPRTGRPRRDPP